MAEIKDENRASFPGKVIVTLKAGGIFFAIANVVCVALIVWGYLAVKIEPKTIQVTGSARKVITSDLVTWSASVTVKAPQLLAAYEQLKANSDKARAYLLAHGLNQAEVKLSAINTSRRFEQKFIAPTTQVGSGDKAPQPVLVTTDQVAMYTLTQVISVESRDVARIPEVARSITELIKDGVEIDSGPCSFLYTKLSELKIDMLAEATKDATARAEKIVNNTNSRLGKLVEARMGVMQINPKNISATSSEGNNDTTSLEKEISTIVSTRFEVK